MSLWETIPRSGVLSGRDVAIRVAELEGGSCLTDGPEILRGRCVLLAVADHLTAAAALVELDGVVERVVLCPPGVARAHLPHVARSAQADAWVGDGISGAAPRELGLSLSVEARPRVVRAATQRRITHQSEWVLLTSGTTGAPKLVVHTLKSLTSAFVGRPPESPAPATWSTFYDIRRYGGLQIYLRGLYGGSLVLSDAAEAPADFLARAAASGVTHISGTPSHWRKALMSGAARRIAPRYVRLSGEIADQSVLDALQGAFPQATVAHAFASTEAGVGFEVRDGLAGFPASFVGISREGTEIDVSHGTLRIRSPGNALRYLGDGAPPLKDAEGFVDMGDNLELHHGRYYFMGRAGGIINVGGLKVHPEEVEAVINSHPAVRMSLVKARRSPITGAVVTADVVLAEALSGTAEASPERIQTEILGVCRASLPAHKIPAAIRIVPAIELSPSGKLVRPHA